MPESLLIAILAAGASRRLRAPKQLLTIGDETLLHRQCRVALESKIGKVVAILGSQAEACRAAIEELEVKIEFNADWQEGMASSVRTAAQLAAAGNYQGLLIMLVDQYLLTSVDLLSVADAWSSHPRQIAVAASGDYMGPPAIFPARYYPELLKLQGDRGAKSLLNQLPATAVHRIEISRAATDCDSQDDVHKMIVSNDLINS